MPQLLLLSLNPGMESTPSFGSLYKDAVDDGFQNPAFPPPRVMEHILTSQQVENQDDRRIRRVLMICYFFPPILASGALRSVGFARRLHKFGWKPHVLTVREAKEPWEAKLKTTVPSDLDITKVAELNFAGFLDFLQGIANRIYKVLSARPLTRPFFRNTFGVPDAHIGWLFFRKAVPLARVSDCIYVSCTPFSSAVLAVLLKVLTGKPLIVDLRDPWAVCSQTQKDLWLERKVVASADKVILNTKTSLRLYRTAYPEFRRNFECIPNGVDEPIRAVGNRAGKRPVRIVHAGSFYLNRKPDLLLAALAKLGDAGVSFVQVGDGTEALSRYADKVRITVTGIVTPEEARRHIANADIVYLKQGFNVTQCIAAKTYEYLSTGIPILAECPIGDDAELIAKYAKVSEIITTEDENAMIKALRRLLVIIETYDPQPNPEFLERFNRDRLTKQLADVLDDVVKTGIDEKPAAA